MTGQSNGPVREHRAIDTSNNPTASVADNTTHPVTAAAEQVLALNAIEQWYRGTARKSVFHLDGPAGTGKTRLAQMVPPMLGLSWCSTAGGPGVQTAAYTGKAVYALKKKGCVNARTIHSMIYACSTVDHSAQIEYLVRLGGSRYQAELARLQREHGTKRTTLRRDSTLRSADLLILDEVSMVDSRMLNDLLSFGVPILVLGDRSQLPPIHGEGALTGGRPDAVLTEIHRQALDSPVLALATDVRLSTDSRFGVPFGTHRGDVSIEELAAFDQVICWTNAKRWNLIEKIRQYHERPAGVPVAGDRVMCLRNDSQLGIFNGQQFVVFGDERTSDPRTVRLNLVDADAGAMDSVICWLDGFTPAGLASRERTAGIASMTFANAITCHKAQGSEWGSVLVIDQSHGLVRGEMKRGKSEEEARREGRRWLYTAITRASKSVTLAAA